MAFYPKILNGMSSIIPRSAVGRGWVDGGNTLPLKNLEEVTKVCPKKMRLKRLILKSERNHYMFVEAGWPDMNP